MVDRFNKVSDSFVCPYCLNESKLDKIQFRSTNPNHKKNVYDEKKSMFWNGILNNDIHFFDSIAVTPRIRNHGLHLIKNKAMKKVPVAYVDENNFATDERLCPICHNNLPDNIGFVNTANILVLGDNSENNFKFVKSLFESLLDNCLLDKTTFYIPNEREWIELSNFNSASSIKYLTGKAVVSSSIKKTFLEITITYYPLGLSELKYINTSQMSKFLLNSNGLIIISDYEKLLDSKENDTSNPDLEQYIFKLKNIIGMGSNYIDSLPVAVVFSGAQALRRNNINAVFDYEEEIVSNVTKNFLQSINNKILQNLCACFSNCGFFSVNSNPDKNEKLAYQNPIRWIFDESRFIKNNSNDIKRR